MVLFGLRASWREETRTAQGETLGKCQVERLPPRRGGAKPAIDAVRSMVLIGVYGVDREVHATADQEVGATCSLWSPSVLSRTPFEQTKSKGAFDSPLRGEGPFSTSNPGFRYAHPATPQTKACPWGPRPWAILVLSLRDVCQRLGASSFRSFVTKGGKPCPQESNFHSGGACNLRRQLDAQRVHHG
jgi:hypothetical protein